MKFRLVRLLGSARIGTLFSAFATCRWMYAEFSRTYEKFPMSRTKLPWVWFYKHIHRGFDEVGRRVCLWRFLPKRRVTQFPPFFWYIKIKEGPNMKLRLCKAAMAYWGRNEARNSGYWDSGFKWYCSLHVRRRVTLHDYHERHLAAVYPRRGGL